MEEKECIFCKIIEGEIPSDKIYEDEQTFAFLDIAPTTKGHALIVAKNHAENIEAVSEDDLCAMAATVKKIGKAIMDALGVEGYNVIINNRKAAGQVVPHVHFHIIPRYPDDGLKLWAQGKYAGNEGAEHAEKIKKALQ
ncbi:MAG: HIT family protein [Candidatus Diapherotrites archaeon]|nr:HIT family protein [Candidatus Micrarchaeota archaeon]MBU1939660.1 HIT family protein [Candidatus Micrarchaeota archaeon]